MRSDFDRIERLDPAVVKMLRSKTCTERLAMAFEMNRTLRLIMATQLQAKHPEWSAEQLAAEVARRWLRGELGHDDS
jgi:hypothetical protein